MMDSRESDRMREGTGVIEEEKSESSLQKHTELTNYI